MRSRKYLPLTGLLICVVFGSAFALIYFFQTVPIVTLTLPQITSNCSPLQVSGVAVNGTPSTLSLVCPRTPTPEAAFNVTVAGTYYFRIGTASPFPSQYSEIDLLFLGGGNIFTPIWTHANSLAVPVQLSVGGYAYELQFTGHSNVTSIPSFNLVWQSTQTG